MWYLVYCLVETANTCYKLGRSIGDVRPANILLNKAGKLKILSYFSLPSNEEIFEENKRIYHTLFSPE